MIRSLLLFTRQWECLLNSGMPLLRALEVLKDNSDEALSAALDKILHQLNHGSPASVALAQHPRVFPPVYIAMIRVAEKTGKLNASLSLLGHWLETEVSTRGKVGKALTYPALVLVLTLSLATLVMARVVPPFLALFREARLPLPWPTWILMQLYDLATHPLPWLLALVVGAGFAVLLRRRLESPDGACELYDWLARVPVAGWMLHSAALVRWSGALAAMLEVGLGMPGGLRLAGQAAGDPRLARDAGLAARSVEEGQPLSVYLQSCDLYPRSIASLVAAGEESSRIPEMLRRCAAIHGEALDGQIETLGATLEPALLTFVAGMVAFVLVAIFLPLYSFIDKLGG